MTALADQTGIAPRRILPGAGSSALVFLAFSRWLRPGARVLILDPTYGEYAHAAELGGAKLHRFTLDAPRYALDLDRWQQAAAECDLVVIVNPNNPTGQAIPAHVLEAAIQHIPSSTRLWIDEAYAPYAPGTALDLRRLDLPNLFVVRSMSKAFALSGLRVAYLVGPETEMEALRRWSPPWAVSLPAQIAAVAALNEADYYGGRYAETAQRREDLAQDLRAKGFWVEDGVGNWVLAKLPPDAPVARTVVDALSAHRVFIRDAGRTSPVLGDRYLRIAVRPGPETSRILSYL